MSATSNFASSILPMKLYRNKEDYWKSLNQGENAYAPHSIVSIPSQPSVTAWTFDVRASWYDAESGGWKTRKDRISVSSDDLIDTFRSLRGREGDSPASKLTIPGEKEKEVWVFARSDFGLGDHAFKPQRGRIGRVDTYQDRETIWVEKHSLDEDGHTIHVRVSNTDMTGAGQMLLHLAGKASTQKTGTRGRETIGLTMFKGDVGTLRRVYQKLEHDDPVRQSVVMGLAKRDYGNSAEGGDELSLTSFRHRDGYES